MLPRGGNVEGSLACWAQLSCDFSPSLPNPPYLAVDRGDTLTAAAFGIEETVFEALMSDPNGAPIDGKMKPILRLARRLTLEPAKTVQADIDAITEAGWNEQTAHDAILVCCMFNFMNRLLDGHGVKGNPEMYRSRVKILAHPAAYDSGQRRKNE